MSKSSFLNDKMYHKSRIALICILGMFAGFLVSRALLSISMFIFGLNAIRHLPPRQWLRQRWWLLGLVWVALYALSWFWSVNKAEWNTHLQTKLPFLLLPLAFSYQPRFSHRQLHIFTLSIALMLIASACYTVGHFFINPAFYISEYKVSHMLPTLPKNDHIRSSMAAALSVIWCIYAWPQLQGRRIKILVGICVALLIAYIHILAAKTGLLSLYLFIAAWGIYMSFGKRRLLGIAVIVALPLCTALAIRYIPTLRERANYIDYTIYMYTHQHRTAVIGDIARLISYNLATDLIAQHPWTGVGTGDMKAEMDTLYFRYHPEINEHGRLLPHNQFLVVGIGCGIPAMLVFAAWVFAPLRLLRRNRQSFFFAIVWLILLIQLLIEPALEVQFGVFVYLFFLLLFLQQLGTSTTHPPSSPSPPTS